MFVKEELFFPLYFNFGPCCQEKAEISGLCKCTFRQCTFSFRKR